MGTFATVSTPPVRAVTVAVPGTRICVVDTPPVRPVAVEPNFTEVVDSFLSFSGHPILSFSGAPITNF